VKKGSGSFFPHARGRTTLMGSQKGSCPLFHTVLAKREILIGGRGAAKPANHEIQETFPKNRESFAMSSGVGKARRSGRNQNQKSVTPRWTPSSLGHLIRKNFSR